MTDKAPDRLMRMRTLRDQLTDRLESCESDYAFAQLAAQLRDTLIQIEQAEKALPSAEETPLDELLAKRRDRSSATKGPAKPARQKSR